jgi:FkbH-like protein
MIARSLDHAEPDDANAAGLLAARVAAAPSRLVDLWLALGENGPTGAAEEGRDDAFYTRRYLAPLARLFLGAIRGSTNHRAVYLDERMRCLPGDLDAAGRAGLLSRRLDYEAEAVAAAFAGPGLPRSAILAAFHALHADLTRSAADGFRLLLVGDCVFVETRAFAQQRARETGLDLAVEHVFFSAKQGVFSIDDVLVSIRRAAPDLIGLSLFSFEGIPPYVALMRDAYRLSDAALEARVSGLVDLLGDAIDGIRALTDAPIAIHNAGGLPIAKLRRQLPLLPALSRGERRVTALIARKIAELAGSRDNTLVIDEVALVRDEGGHRAAGRPVFAAADVPNGAAHTSQFGPILAESYLGLIRDVQVLGRAKVLLVDFDNTLWSGVMAEGPVKHDLAGQRLLKRLREAGILLVALSKNSPDSIRWDEMVLGRDDFVLHKISWQPKPDGVSQAVAELDLAASAFVLLDDNPAERALVTESVPGVQALDPAQPETWLALERWLSFPSTKRTDEARRRTELYREAAERRRAMAGVHDYAAMMGSLGLRLGFRRAGRGDTERLLELTQRTNQFNTTTNRRSAADLAALAASDAHAIYVASLSDRFGSLGVVALAIIERRPDAVVFDSVIMSCRAMGFGLEYALLRRVIDHEPAASYRGLFVPSPRNSPAAGLFEGAGFTQTDGEWVLPTDATLPVVPAWFAEEGRVSG